MKGHVAVAPVGSSLGEGEAQLGDEARREAAALDKLQEDLDRSAYVPVGHEGWRIELRQASQVGLGETLRQGHPVALLVLCLVGKGAIVCESRRTKQSKTTLSGLMTQNNCLKKQIRPSSLWS